MTLRHSYQSSRWSCTFKSIGSAIIALAFLLLLFYASPTAYAVAEESEASASESASEPEDFFAVALNPDRDYLIVINDDHEYIFGGEYDQALQGDIVYVSDCYGELTPIEKAANTAFTLLRQSLFDEGIYVQVYSAYRTREDQEWVYDYYGHLEGWADTNKVSRAGFSEHHTGLLLNIMALWPEVGIWATETPERSAEDPNFFGRIHASLADFGFVDRYPAGKEEFTGCPCEPYEIRFVGSSKIAHEIMDNGLCLEEYLAQTQAP